MANSETMTPVRQNFKKLYTGGRHDLVLDCKGKQLLPPNLPKDNDSVTESLKNNHLSSAVSIDESKEEGNEFGADAEIVHPSPSEGNGDVMKVDWMEEDLARVDWPEEEEIFTAINGSETMDESIHSDSEDSQETLLSYYKQRTADLANRRKQARELRKQGCVFVDEEESVKIPGFPFISGIKMGALNSLAGDFDCSFFTASKNAEDASDDGSGNLDEGTFDEDEDYSILSYDDEDTYRTLGSTRTLESTSDGIDHALKWADENFLCNQS